MLGNPLSNTLGNNPFTSPSIEFIILALNCSDETYLYVKKPPTSIHKIMIVDRIVKASRIFLMVKEAVLKAIGHVSIISFLIILPTVIPLYLIGGMMTRQLQEKVN